MRAIQKCRERCACEMECADAHSGNLGWERRIDVEDRLVGADAEEAEGNDLIGAAVARKERKGRVGVAVQSYVVDGLLGELVPGSAEVGEEAVEGIGIG